MLGDRRFSDHQKWKEKFKQCQKEKQNTIPGPDGEFCKNEKEVFEEIKRYLDYDQHDEMKEYMDKACAVQSGPPGPRRIRRGRFSRRGYPPWGFYGRRYGPRRFAQ